jgi:antitoxin component YwqK of YwqJK toxin-antitoxin module
MTRLPLKFAFALSVAALWGPSVQPAGAQQPVAKAAAEPVYLDEPEPAPEPTIAREGPLTEKYEDGKVRVERNIRQLSDNKIVNHGKFTEYYRNGQKFSEGSFNAGVHDGPWTFWHENGQLAKTVNFVKGQPDGAWEVFRADGTLQAKKGYKAGKRDGTWVSYFEDGKTPTIEQTFVDGKPDGPVNLYYKSGKPRIQTVFKAGVREGVSTEWDESGRKVAEATYAKGKLDGKLTRYNADGTTTVEMWQDGKRIQAGTAAAAPPAAAPAAAPGK